MNPNQNYMELIHQQYTGLIHSTLPNYSYYGYITQPQQSIHNYTYYIELSYSTAPNHGTHHAMYECAVYPAVRFYADSQLYNLLINNNKYNYITLLSKRIKQYNLSNSTNTIYYTMYIIVYELQQLIECIYQLQSTTTCTQYNTNNIQFLAELTNQLLQLDINKIQPTDNTLHKFTIVLSTQNTKHTHQLYIVLPYNWPNTAALIHSYLPIQPPPNNTIMLSEQIEQYQLLINSLQLYFDQLVDLDQNTWIVEPDKMEPINQYQYNYRRIKYDDNISIHITIDIHNACGIPKLLFIGNTRYIQSYIDRWSCTIELHEQWDQQQSIRWNIQHYFDIELPNKPITTTVNNHTANELNDDLCCIICYTYELDDELPTIQCTNQSCLRSYHHSCLVEWLQNNITCHKLFNTLFGQCVHCEQSIQVKLNNY